MVSIVGFDFSRQGYGSVLPFPSPGDLLNPGIEPTSPALAGGLFTAEPQGSPIVLSMFAFLLSPRLVSVLPSHISVKNKPT